MRLRLQVQVPADCLPCDDWHHAFWTPVALWGQGRRSVAQCGACGATWSWIRGTGGVALVRPGPEVNFTVRRAA